MIAITWFGRIWDNVCSHCEFYVRFAGDQWHHMTPVKYTSLLISIAVVGLMLMGRGNKRT